MRLKQTTSASKFVEAFDLIRQNITDFNDAALFQTFLFASAPYRMSPRELEELRKQLKDLIDVVLI
ncbi:hypothetical protein CXG81DRAFT_28858 [Caulochytrium protostelioides]|uniref:Uncharacterized protein n=1 Tax=Caulochytrium protostelioides TaxID=1555241 RepID=A0A4P9WXT9_9FUNG|nr:hypothetical protein CXG81DRAFT_28858 [Caulochytrium protostelioides]|eukprot:RKO98299.1 hypothetical protein CXG81DRAFT_28858 [Caulochytrium protostelioides]